MSKAYETITARIVEMIEAGTCPWRMPWSRIEIGDQMNGTSDNAYRGINQMMTFMTAYTNGYTSPYWLTYKQASELGGQVRKGEKGTPVVRFGEYTRENKDTGNDETGVFLKLYYVFNVAQIDGLEDDKFAPRIADERDSVQAIAACEEIVDGWIGKPEIVTEGQRACYSPKWDRVKMPKQAAFESDAAYYATLFHELGHATGHEDRLARKGVVDLVSFGSHEYGQEELVAEMTAAFLCNKAGIDNDTIEQSAAYLAAWLKTIKKDPKMVVVAAGQAQKAADLILSQKPALATA